VTSRWNFAKRLATLLLCACALGSLTQTEAHQAQVRKSGTSYLSPQLQELQNDADKNPAQLWITSGMQLWQSQCSSCHGDISSQQSSAARFPKLDGNKKLINLEDFIERHTATKLSARDVLALSAALHQAAKGVAINVLPAEPHYSQGKTLWNTRMGRINLACAHCHEDKVGAHMRGDVVSQAQPTGFPIYRMTWQSLGSLERRLRACYSGVQAPLPPVGSPELRDLELFLKVRANGMTIDGPSVRR
jgi:L-cysteine S-thiosulfotransferase